MSHPATRDLGPALHRVVWAALVALAAAEVVTGCARFEARPLSAREVADAFERRTLADDGLARLLATNHVPGLPDGAWDLERLTAAAFYFHPDMRVARARWRTAMAARRTAGQRPNPNVAFTPRLNSTSLAHGASPWILGGVLDIPIETMGKRKHRVAQAQHLGETARFDLAGTAWLVRSRVRDGLLALQGARETASLVQEQASTLERLARMVEIQWEAGAVSPLEVSAARLAHQAAQLNLKDTWRQQANARAQLAAAIGVPFSALDGVRLVFPNLAVFPTNLVAGEVQRHAVLNRADVLSTLAEYAASESALQLQIARQYPDIHLRPGYELDQTENKWQLGVSLDLPVLNQNRGPIAEAEAKREEIAAKFQAVQARVIGETAHAAADYSAAVDQAVATDQLLANLQQRTAALARMREAGEVDQTAVTSAQAECLNGALARLKARIQVQQSLAALENAVQAPLLMPVPTAAWETVAQNPGPTSKP